MEKAIGKLFESHNVHGIERSDSSNFSSTKIFEVGEKKLFVKVVSDDEVCKFFCIV